MSDEAAGLEGIVNATVASRASTRREVGKLSGFVGAAGAAVGECVGREVAATGEAAGDCDGFARLRFVVGVAAGDADGRGLELGDAAEWFASTVGLGLELRPHDSVGERGGGAAGLAGLCCPRLPLLAAALPLIFARRAASNG